MSEQLYRLCPDCNGRGSISVMNGRGDETEYQCERCFHGNGFVPVEAFEAGFFINERGVPEVLTSDVQVLEGGSYLLVRVKDSE